MTPHFEEDGIALYLGDALEILPTIPYAKFVITDPPYIIGAVSSGSINSKSGTWADMMNSTLWFATWYREVARLVASDGAFWSFLNWRTLPVVMKAHADARLPLTSLMVWDKQWIGPGGNQGLRPSYELISLSAAPGFAIPDRGTPDIIQHQGAPSSFRQSDHPAEKPLALVRRLLEMSGAVPGDVVLDPFLGSGTTAVACRELGLDMIGIEADEQHMAATIARLGQRQLFQGDTNTAPALSPGDTPGPVG